MSFFALRPLQIYYFIFRSYLSFLHTRWVGKRELLGGRGGDKDYDNLHNNSVLCMQYFALCTQY